MQEEFLVEKDYSDMPENSVISLIQDGDVQALNYILKKYNNIVNIKASKFFAAGIDKDDIVQEGMIGLYKATKSYNTEKQNSFKNFANLCIERQLITVIKSANRQKNIPLNSAFSLNTPIYDSEDADIIEVLDVNTMEDPLDTITKKEYFDLVEKMMDECLSDFEKNVLKYYKLGKSYVDIAEAVDSKVKSVDTAIQRIRKKAYKVKTKLEGE